MKFLLVVPALVIGSAMFAPDVASAQGLVGGVCDGPDCSSCDIVVLANSFIDWLIGAIMIVFAILMVWAGFGLVTANGNPSAMTDAKNKFTNAIIGLVIVLSAWLIVDTVMIGLLGNNGQIDRGELGLLPWSEIECTTQSVAGIDPDGIDVIEESRALGGVSTETNIISCSNVDQCAALAAECSARADSTGTVVTNPDTGNLQVECTAPLSGLSAEQLAQLGTGAQAIIAYAQQMDNQSCQYSQPNRNSCSGSPGYTDCSQLVADAYRAAGCRSPGSYTGNMIGNARAFSSASELRAGDAPIHRTNGAGHIVICMDDGCSRVIHAQGSRTGIVISSGSTYTSDPRYVSAIRVADFCN